MYSVVHTILSLSPGQGPYFCGAKVSKTLSRIFVASLLDSAEANAYKRNKNKATFVLIFGRCGNCKVCDKVTS